MFDKLSSVFSRGNRTRDDQPNHIRVRTEVPREVGQAWVAMCPAKVYEIDDDADGDGTVEVSVNAVELRAVRRDHRQGRALTPPEGGSGPEYTLT